MSRANVQRARVVLDRGTPELIAAVDQGRVSVNAAAVAASMPAEQRAHTIAQLVSGETPTRVPKSRRREGEGMRAGVRELHDQGGPGGWRASCATS